MKCYLTAGLTISDPSWVKSYTAPVTALVEKHGGKFLARSTHLEKLEGDGEAPEIFVIIEFPSEEAAQAFYHDPEYKPHLDARLAGASGELLLVAGEDVGLRKSGENN